MSLSLELARRTGFTQTFENMQDLLELSPSDPKPPTAADADASPTHLRANLDITKISDRILVVSRCWTHRTDRDSLRNNIEDLALYLNSRYDRRYFIWNLGSPDIHYNSAPFNNQVVNFALSRALSPSLKGIFNVCRSLTAWLSIDRRNVAIIQCKNGRTRSGLVVACFLRYSELFDSTYESFEYFVLHRSPKNVSWVTVTLRRYLRYFNDVLILNGRVPNPMPLQLHQVILNTVPNFDGEGSCDPGIEVYHNGKLFFSSRVRQADIAAGFAAPAGGVHTAPASRAPSHVATPVLRQQDSFPDESHTQCEQDFEDDELVKEFHINLALQQISLQEYNPLVLKDDHHIVFRLENLTLCQDVQIRIYHHSAHSGQNMTVLNLVFNTGFVAPGLIRLRPSDMELPFASQPPPAVSSAPRTTKNPPVRFHPDFSLDIIVTPLEQSAKHVSYERLTSRSLAKDLLKLSQFHVVRPDPSLIKPLELQGHRKFFARLALQVRNNDIHLAHEFLSILSKTPFYDSLDRELVSLGKLKYDKMRSLHAAAKTLPASPASPDGPTVNPSPSAGDIGTGNHSKDRISFYSEPASPAAHLASADSVQVESLAKMVLVSSDDDSDKDPPKTSSPLFTQPQQKMQVESKAPKVQDSEAEESAARPDRTAAPVKAPQNPRIPLSPPLPPLPSKSKTSPNHAASRPDPLAKALPPPVLTAFSKASTPSSPSSPLPPPPPPLPRLSAVCKGGKAGHLPPPPPPPLPRSANLSQSSSNADVTDITGTASESSDPELTSKLKAKSKLHWEEIHDRRVIRNTVWLEFMEQLPDYDPSMLDVHKFEELFCVDAESKMPSGTEPSQNEKLDSKPVVHILNLRRVNNIGIGLSRFYKRLSDKQIIDAIIGRQHNKLSIDDLLTLKPLLPTAEERESLLLYSKSPEQLGVAERFMLVAARERHLSWMVDALIFERQFDGELSSISEKLTLIIAILTKIRESPSLKVLLRIVLELGNLTNYDYGHAPAHVRVRGKALGFKMESLIKLQDVKSVDKKTNLLQYIVMTLSDRNQEVFNLPTDFVDLSIVRHWDTSAILNQLDEIALNYSRLKNLELPGEEQDKSQVESFRQEQQDFLYSSETKLASCKSLAAILQQSWKKTSEYLGEEHTNRRPEELFLILNQFFQSFAHAIKTVKGSEKQKNAKISTTATSTSPLDSLTAFKKADQESTGDTESLSSTLSTSEFSGLMRSDSSLSLRSVSNNKL